MVEELKNQNYEIEKNTQLLSFKVKGACKSESYLKKKRSRIESQISFDSNSLNQLNSRIVDNISTNDKSVNTTIKKKKYENVDKLSINPFNYDGDTKSILQISNNKSKCNAFVNLFKYALDNSNGKEKKKKSIDLTTLVLTEKIIPGQAEDDYYLELKQRYHCYFDPNYFNFQTSIKHIMRSELIDWMMELCSYFGFKRATFHLSVTLLDIALSRLDKVHNSKLQLVGVTSVVIAAKNEEIYCPKIQEYSFTTQEGCSSSEIIEFELLILKAINWKTNFPTTATWINLITHKWDIWLRYKISVDLRFRSMPFFRFNIIGKNLMFDKIIMVSFFFILIVDSTAYSDIFNGPTDGCYCCL